MIDPDQSDAERLNWIRVKLGLPLDTPMFAGSGPTIAGAMHVMCSHAYGYETYIVAYKCNDKQGEIARLTVRIAELEAEAATIHYGLNVAGADVDIVAQLRRDIIGREKQHVLLLAGMESMAENLDVLKQKCRAAEGQLASLRRAVHAALQRTDATDMADVLIGTCGTGAGKGAAP